MSRDVIAEALADLVESSLECAQVAANLPELTPRIAAPALNFLWTTSAYISGRPVVAIYWRNELFQDLFDAEVLDSLSRCDLETVLRNALRLGRAQKWTLLWHELRNTFQLQVSAM